MADKKKRKPRGKKPHGHYCRVCGAHKANEKFSGKGHTAHICKACSALPVAERNELITLRKIESMAPRSLSGQEIRWLRDKMNDQRPVIAEAARETHRMKFPRYERNQIRKGLTAFSLELFIHSALWDEWGDEIPVHARVSLDDAGMLQSFDFSTPEDGWVAEITVGRQDARRFLKSVVHELDALFWDEDLSDAGPEEYDPYLDVLPEFRPDTEDGTDFDSGIDGGYAGPELPAESRTPVWSLRLELNNGEEKNITFYNQMHDAPRELYWSLMEWFNPETCDNFDDGGMAPEE